MIELSASQSTMERLGRNTDEQEIRVGKVYI